MVSASGAGPVGHDRYSKPLLKDRVALRQGVRPLQPYRLDPDHPSELATLREGQLRDKELTGIVT